MYTPIHVHSTFSLGDAVARIDDIVEKAKKIGCEAISLTEHGNMMSFLKFYKSCKENKIKPIMGCEIYINDLYYQDKERFLELNKKSAEDIGDEKNEKNSHLIILAKNYKGLQNCIHLSNRGFFNFYRKPLLSQDMVFEFLDDNNIITTACLGSIFNKKIVLGKINEVRELYKKYKNKFKDNFYIEFQLNSIEIQRKVNLVNLEFCKELNIKPVFGLDVHYLDKSDYYIQYLLYCIKQKKTIKSMTLDDWFYEARELYFKTEEEINNLIIKEPVKLQDILFESLKNTNEIADKVENFDIELYKNNYPKFCSTKNEADELFLEKIKQGYINKIKNGLIKYDLHEKYLNQAKYEFSLFKEKGFNDYFLIIEDIIKNFVEKTEGFTGAGRGSAPSSVCLWLTDLTKIDPLKYNLIFERFANSARKDPPDIDIDFDSEHQKQIEGYLKDKYGVNKVCHVGNFSRFASKTIVKDLSRIFELNFDATNKLTKIFNDNIINSTIEKEIKNARKILEKLKDYKTVKFIDDNYELFVKIGSKFEGLARQLGKHASGIIISDKKLVDSDLPLQIIGGEIITGIQDSVDERGIAELGYMKLDILGLTTASVINNTFNLIEKKHNTKHMETEILTSDFNDAKVYDEFKKGNTRDIFQFGSDSMINLMIKMQPENIEDLTSLNALWRPGPISAGIVDEYFYNKNNTEKAKEKYNKIHPIIWENLISTYGLIIFQEQIMLILQKLGNFTLTESDSIRKLLKTLAKQDSKKDYTTEFNEKISKFKKSAILNGISEKNANELFNTLIKYSQYSFVKSHSLAYSINAYIAMYLKVHYPLEYFSSLFNKCEKKELSWFMKQAKEQGVTISNFKCGYTSNNFAVDYDNKIITFGLNIVKGISSKDIESINSFNPNNIYEICKLINENKISKRSYEPLCRLQFFENIYSNSKLLEFIINEVKKIKSSNIKTKIDALLEENKDIQDWNEKEKLQFEKKYFEFYFSVHPFNKKFNILKNSFFEGLEIADFKSPTDLKNSVNGSFITCGIITEIESKKSKKTGREYYRIIIEDEYEQIYITTFDSKDIIQIEAGDFIVIVVYKNEYGFTKMKNYKIQKIN